MIATFDAKIPHIFKNIETHYKKEIEKLKKEKKEFNEKKLKSDPNFVQQLKEYEDIVNSYYQKKNHLKEERERNLESIRKEGKGFDEKCKF